MNKEVTHNHNEPHRNGSSNSKLNWLRASVLGANDGIVSIAGLVVGVAGATNSRSAIITVAVAGVLAGALSMAAGEYVSVSTQRDAEKALLAKEKWELENMPEEELAELAEIYQEKGLSKKTAELVAKELSQKDAYKAHIDAELHINPDDLTNPWHAAFASAAAFIAGATIPGLAIVLPEASVRVPITFISVIIALACTGYLSAKIGGSNPYKASLRVVIGGALAMIVTYVIGSLFNVVGV